MIDSELNLPLQINASRSAKVIQLYVEAPRLRLNRIRISSREGIYLLRPEKIAYCQAEGNYTAIFLGDGSKILVSKCLKSVLAELIPWNFVRIHQSYAVFADDIIFIGTNKVVLSNKNQVPMSRRYRKNLICLLG